MKHSLLLSSLLLGLATGVLGAAEPAIPLAKPLEPLRPFLGKTWKGSFPDSTAEKPKVDVVRWERALNGQAVRIVHSINDGLYGGESFVTWNAKAEKIEFHYFTTAGFQTHGTMLIEGAKLITVEQVVGSQDGITEVRATTELLSDGRLRVQSRYLKKGEWIDGRNMTYDPAPGAEVRFK